LEEESLAKKLKAISGVERRFTERITGYDYEIELEDEKL
jgi:hypothetical protein